MRRTDVPSTGPLCGLCSTLTCPVIPPSTSTQRMAADWMEIFMNTQVDADGHTVKGSDTSYEIDPITGQRISTTTRKWDMTAEKEE